MEREGRKATQQGNLEPEEVLTKPSLSQNKWNIGDAITRIVDNFHDGKISQEELWDELHNIEALDRHYRNSVFIQDEEFVDTKDALAIQRTPAMANREVIKHAVTLLDEKIIRELFLSKAMLVAIIIVTISFVGIGMYRRGVIGVSGETKGISLAWTSIATRTPALTPEQNKEPEPSQQTQSANDEKPDGRVASTQIVSDQDTADRDENLPVQTSAPTPQEDPSPNNDISSKPFASMVEQYTNDLRESEGIETLVEDPCLREAAVRRAKEIAVNFLTDHGSNWDHFIKDCPVESYAENLSFHYENPFEAYVGMKDSPSHRAALLGDYTKIGVGTYEKYKGRWVTVMYLGM